ncbi:MAG: dipeptidase [Ktedonobacteraceae bacterium]
MTEQLEHYFSTHRPQHLEQLTHFLTIPSVSTQSEHKDDILRAATFLADHLRTIGFEHVELLATKGNPVVYADWLHAPGKPTVTVYGHYDVQPAEPFELWQSPPFEPTIRDGLIYARGASDDKGQVFLHLKAFEALLAATGKLPVNAKFCLEGEEEIGSAGIIDFLAEHSERFAADVVVVSDTALLGPNQPAICYGLRGLIGMQIDVKGPARDLHSGGMGGILQNPIHALVELLSTMHDHDGRITVDGFYDDVQLISEQERAAFARLPVTDAQRMQEFGVPELFGEAGYTSLERNWTRPTLEINGIYGGYEGEGTKTVLPSEAHAKITCRLVPNQDPQRITALLQEHVKRHTPRGVTIALSSSEAGAPAYVASFDHPAVQVAEQAYARAYNAQTYFVRGGGSIPIVEVFARLLKVPVVLLGFVLPTCNAHAPNESFALENFDKGVRTLCYYWIGLAEAL